MALLRWALTPAQPLGHDLRVQTQRPPMGPRVEPRAPIELKVEYKRLNSFFADYTRNISKGGTFIKTAKPLAIGTEFVFKLSVPKLEAPIELHGRVQWIIEDGKAAGDKDPGMGIGFIYETEADRTRVEAIVEELMRQSLGPSLHQKLMSQRKAGETP